MIDKNERPILCVDDTEEQRYVTARILRLAGYRVIEAATGAEALSMILDQSPLAVVLDVNLPDMSGYEVCQQIRSDPKIASTPVLQISASFADPEQRAIGLSGGADAYVLQPFHREELVALIKALIRSRQSEEILEIMSEASVTLSRSLEYTETRDAVLTTLVPRFADQCFVLTSAGWEDGKDEVPDYLKDAASQLLLKGASMCLGREGMAPGTFSAMLTPLTVAGRRKGVLAFVLAGGDRAYTISDLAIAQDFGSRSALALQNATLYTAQQAAQDALVRSEKLAAAGRMAAAMAHEINNPLEAITNLVYLLSTSPTLSSDDHGYADQALQELARLAHLTRQALGFYRELTNPAGFALADSVDEVVSLYATKLAQKQITVQREFLTRGEMVGIKGEIRQVISNLLLNSVDAMRFGGTLSFRLTETDDAVFVLHAQDDGSGIPAKHLPQIFEPFFTTKAGTGTGLGLWVSNNIVQKHGGCIDVESSDISPGSGTTFSVRLPSHPSIVGSEDAVQLRSRSDCVRT